MIDQITNFINDFSYEFLLKLATVTLGVDTLIGLIKYWLVFKKPISNEFYSSTATKIIVIVSLWILSIIDNSEQSISLAFLENSIALAVFFNELLSIYVNALITKGAQIKDIPEILKSEFIKKIAKGK